MNATETTTSGLRELIATLARGSSGGLVDTATAVTAWSVPNRVATSRLHRLVKSGWLLPVRRGLFYVLPLGATAATTVDDPWVLASRAFAPCYVGGWTAAEHWGLTEQVFRPTFVATAGTARATSLTLLGSEFRIVRVSKSIVESVKPSWRGSVRIAVSDRERTIADALVNPDWVGGIRHLAEVLSTYRRSEHWSPGKLLAALAAHPKGAAYKRLGYLVETVLGGDGTLVPEALARKSTGVIALDPQVKARGKILNRWGLRINAAVSAEAPS